jgi:hypothetical protein
LTTAATGREGATACKAVEDSDVAIDAVVEVVVEIIPLILLE